MDRKLPALLSALAALSAAPSCHKTPIPSAAVPPVTVRPAAPAAGGDYTQKILAGKWLKKRLAVARFVDNQPVAESPFGHKEQVDVVGSGISLHREEMVPESDEPSSAFTPRLIDALARTKRFVLVERKDINALLRELSFGETKWTDKEKSGRAGKVLGAQIILTGSIVRSRGVELFLRMYDVETGRIVGTARAAGRNEDEAIDNAVHEILSTMDNVPWVGKIAAVSGEKYFLNAGTAENINVGDRFEISSLGKAIADPDTRETIGYEEEEAARGEVVAVSERTATLKISDAKRAVKVGDKAQPARE